MSDPVVPNFINGIGRLATDRFTYEKHVTGIDDRHKANQIDLFPTVVIGTTKTTVQDAIEAISLVIGTPPPDASTTVKGIVKLAGDIAGTATSVSVTKIQGKPISTLTPTSGDVLTWDGSVWKPQSISGTFANLTVTGNTTLGTNSSNTLVVNAQTTLSNNLTVNGNTVLGNANSDTTTIQGILTVSGGDVSITGGTTTTLNGNTNLNMAGGSTATLVSGGALGLTAGTSLGLTAGTSLGLTAGTSMTLTTTSGALNLNGHSIVISPALYTSLNGNVQQSTGQFSIFTGSSFYLFGGVITSIQSSLLMSGSAKINKKYALTPDLNTLIYPALTDVFITQGAGLTNNRTYTINETTYPAAIAGFEFEIINTSGFILSINDTTSSFIGNVGVSEAATFYRGLTNWLLKYTFSMV